MKLSEKICYCRRKAGLSQEVLAEVLGVSRQAVSKWETGDAVPEIGKLMSLAKTFGVTTDWLLSEEEPEADENNSAGNFTQDKTSSAERFEKAAEDWMDRIPGIFGKMVKKFGWLAGVYIALGGAGSTLMGVLAKVMVGGFNKMANGMIGGFGGFGGFGSGSVTFYDESGNALSARESAKLAEVLGMGATGGMNSITDSMNGMLQNNPVNIIANFLLIGGLIALIGGSILAIVWYKKSKEQNR